MRTNPQLAMHVLLVSDNPEDVRIVEQLLTEAHADQFALKHCSSLAAAIDGILRDAPQVVLLDLGLPDAIGLDMLARLLYAIPPIPVIVLTGLDDPGIGLAAVDLGAQDYLVKGSFDGETLLRCMRYAIERSEHISELQKSKELFRSMFESSVDCIAIVGSDRQCLYANQGCADIVDKPRESLVGKRAAEILDHLPGLAEAWKNRVADVFSSGKRGHYEDSTTLPNGRKLDSESETFPVLDQSGAIFAVGIILRDVTEAKQAEMRIMHLNEVLWAVRGINKLICKIKDPERLLQEACDLLVDVRGYDSGWAAKLDRNGAISVLVQTNTGPRFDSFAKDLYQGLIPPCVQRALEQEQAVYCVDRQHDCHACSRKSDDDTGTPLVLLLSHDNVLHGFLSVTIPGATRVSSDELGLLDEVTGDLGFALHDIEMERMRDAAEFERNRLVAAIEHTDEGIVITDAEGAIQYVNPAFTRMTGYTAAEVLGKNPRVLNSGEQSQAYYQEMWATIKSGTVWTGHFRNRRKDGTIYEEDSTISSIRDDSGEIVNFVALKRDVTVQVEMERHLRQSQKLEAVGTLAGGIAHDFNNILAAIMGYAELALMQAAGNEQLSRDLTQVMKAGGRARDLVGQILQFSRQTEMQRSPVCLTPIVKEVSKLIRSTLPTTIDISLNLNAAPHTVLVDPTEFHQILMNLCTNAYHAMRGRGGTLSLGLDLLRVDDPIELALRELDPGEYALLSVSDTGHGMDQATMDQIFLPFFTTKEQGEGTGLGLSTVHGIVKNNGGAIRVYSEVGSGTSFRIYLPLVAEVSQREAMQPALLPRGQGQRVLVVDDEAALVDMLAAMLSNLGYSPRPFNSSLQALEALRTAPDDYDLVFTDQTMPEMTGIALLRELRHLRPGMPAIIATGFSENIVKNAKEAGVVAVLRKPVLLQELAGALHKALQPEEAGL